MVPVKDYVFEKHGLKVTSLYIAQVKKQCGLAVGESYNKAFEYFAAGKPVFYTVRPGYSIVEKYRCGRLTDGFEPKDIAEGIQNMAELGADEKREMAINARKTAEIYDFKNLTNKLVEIIER